MEDKIFRDSNLPIDVRVEDLLKRMSLEEKINQLGCKMFVKAMDTAEARNIVNGIGEIALLGGKDTVEETAEFIEETQRYIIEHSPLGIPAIFHCEALSGPVYGGTVQNPTSFSLGATFDDELVKEMSTYIRKQMVPMGIRQALSPVLDIAQDLKWGRVSETYGGDPTLSAKMACAFVEGLQGEDLSDGVAATAKHFLGYSKTEGSLNLSKTEVTERDLREVFAKPFEAVINKSKIKSIMNSYSEINGEPVCASKDILTNMLRDDLKFDGLVVSDYASIQRLVDVFKTKENMKSAAIQCLEAGLDVELPEQFGYGSALLEAVENGEISIDIINRSVERVLRLKFELGLFENPYPNIEELKNVYPLNEAEELAKEITYKTMTLTKNDGILPIKDKTKKIAVIGPSGNSLRHMYAGYTYPAMLEMLLGTAYAMAGVQIEGDSETPKSTHILGGTYEDLDKVNAIIKGEYPKAKTIFEALKDEFENVEFVQGCHTKNDSCTDIESAKKAAAEADIVIMTLGGKNGWGLHCTSGEGVDSVKLSLWGRQEELLKEVYKANPNIVLVHTDSKPLTCNFAYDNIPAILEGWLSGTYGGQAIADTLIGKNNPGGKLHVDVPRHSGTTPVFHYQHRGSGLGSLFDTAINPKGYINCNAKPVLPFGHGLSYTEFKYSDFSMNVGNEAIPEVNIRMSVENTGNVAGDEVVQLYGIDTFASMIRPRQEFIGFKRITLLPNEKKHVTFNFTIDQLAFMNKEYEWIVEAGEFEFFVGKNSDEKIAEFDYVQEKTIAIDPAARSFFAEAIVE